MIGIYKFTNKYNRKIYVGKSTNIKSRYYKHLQNAKLGRHSYFYTALRKYGSDGFDFDILIECPKEGLDYWETFYIRYYCSNNPDYGYNMTDGGDGITNPCEEERKRRSDYAKEHYNGEKNPFYNRKHSEETKQKIRDKLTGVKTGNRFERTDEWKKKLSEAHKGKEPWNKGIKTGPNPKLSEAKKGKEPWNKVLLNCIPEGRLHTDCYIKY